MRGDALLGALLAGLDDVLPAAIELRHRLHLSPSLSHHEEPTALAVERALAPLPVRRPVSAAVAAELGGPGRPVVVRAELDGLPITEQTGAPFASTNGAMHACGHDVHMAALVALCWAAARLRSLPAPLLALFQHSEEAYPSGALDLCHSPDLSARPPLAVAAVHVHPGVALGSVTADPGTVNAAADNFRILVRGRGGHAAYPHLVADPVVALSQVVVALQHIVSRRVDPLHSVVVSVSRLRAGEAENVIPEDAQAAGTLRTLQPAIRERLRELVVEVATDAARAHGCVAEVTFDYGEPEVANDVALTAAFRELAPAAGLELAPPLRTCGSDDFGYYGALGRSLMVFCGVGAGTGEELPLHHPRFLPPDGVVALVARAQAAACVAGCEVGSTERRGET